MIIDGHAHLFHPRWYPARFLEAVKQDALQRARLSGRAGLLPAGERLLAMLTDATGEATVRMLDRVEIDRRVILIIDWGLELGEPERPIESIHREILGVCGSFPDRLVGFAGLDPRRPDAPGLLRRAIDDMGARGLKLHPTGGWSLADESTHALVDVAAARGLPVVVHVGKTFGALQDRHATPTALAELARAFPGAAFVAAHSGFSRWTEFASLPNLPANLYFDFSGWQERRAEEGAGFAAELARLLRAFPGRVLFGTDSPFYTFNLALAERAWLSAARAIVAECEDLSDADRRRVFSPEVFTDNGSDSSGEGTANAQ
jgi:hypothetical protein